MAIVAKIKIFNYICVVNFKLKKVSKWKELLNLVQREIPTVRAF